MHAVSVSPLSHPSLAASRTCTQAACPAACPLPPPPTPHLAAQVGSCLGNFLKAFGDAALPYVEGLMPSIAPLLDKARPDEERRIALCIIDDMLEHSAAGRAKYLSQVCVFVFSGGYRWRVSTASAAMCKPGLPRFCLHFSTLHGSSSATRPRAVHHLHLALAALLDAPVRVPEPLSGLT